jgi:hypothetical protein
MDSSVLRLRDKYLPVEQKYKQDVSVIFSDMKRIRSSGTESGREYDEYPTEESPLQPPVLSKRLRDHHIAKSFELLPSNS